MERFKTDLPRLETRCLGLVFIIFMHLCTTFAHMFCFLTYHGHAMAWDLMNHDGGTLLLIYRKISVSQYLLVGRIELNIIPVSKRYKLMNICTDEIWNINK